AAFGTTGAEIEIQLVSTGDAAASPHAEKLDDHAARPDQQPESGGKKRRVKCGVKEQSRPDWPGGQEWGESGGGIRQWNNSRRHTSAAGTGTCGCTTGCGSCRALAP